MRDATELVILLDKSGSMALIKNDTIHGFNDFLKTQQNLDKDIYLSLIQFNTDYQWTIESANIKVVPPLTTFNYLPCGGTALLDALDTAIEQIGKRLSNMKEEDRPNKVLFVILTDGEENSSKIATKRSVKKKVQHQKNKYSWEFLFLGANIDAFQESKDLSISHSINYSATPTGIRTAFKSASIGTSAYIHGGTKGLINSNWNQQNPEEEK